MMFYVIITALTDVHVEALIGRLVSHNWVIGPIGGKLIMDNTSENAIGTVIAISMNRPAPQVSRQGVTFAEPTPVTIRDELNKTMDLLGMKRFSIVVSDNTNMALSSSDVAKHPDDAPPPGPEKVIH